MTCRQLKATLQTLREGHAVGLRAKLTLQRKGKKFEVQLFRAAKGHLIAISNILSAVSQVQEGLLHASPAGDILEVFATVKALLVEFGKKCTLQELALGRRLFDVQSNAI